MPNNQTILKSIEEGKRCKGHRDEICKLLSEKPKSIIVLDDDPTGTQTVHDIPVITEWSEQILENELLTSPVFFILTNSRGLQVEDANALGKLIGSRLQKLAEKHSKDLLLVSRSDSTLRGHYPNEVNALLEGLGWEDTKHILAPAFFEGGRYTFNDIHYVQEGDTFTPAAKTPFAKDNTFGYEASNLRDWIIEKSNGKIASDKTGSISIDTLRNKSTAIVESALEEDDISHWVINATSLPDLETVALATLKSKNSFIFRTGASFVNAISGIAPAPLLDKEKISGTSKALGALIVVGSYVPKTTQQLNYLKKQGQATFLELEVSRILETSGLQKIIADLSLQIDESLKTEQNVVLFTSRSVVKGDTKKESLAIVNQVSQALIAIVKRLSVRPKYVLAKGGITSSDLATKALSVKKALILGQVSKGVPVWQLGEDAKYPKMPYIVFPGNVGDERALSNLISKLA